MPSHALFVLISNTGLLRHGGYEKGQPVQAQQMYGGSNVHIHRKGCRRDPTVGNLGVVLLLRRAKVSRGVD